MSELWKRFAEAVDPVFSGYPLITALAVVGAVMAASNWASVQATGLAARVKCVWLGEQASQPHGAHSWTAIEFAPVGQGHDHRVLRRERGVQLLDDAEQLARFRAGHGGEAGLGGADGAGKW